MARNITLTLGAGLGADLGPNFNLTANVGSVTPSTATKTELTAGKSVSVDDAATQVTVTSTGTCTNAITQTIPCATTTTTTAAPTTTTTTTIAPNTFNVTNNGSSNYIINGSSNPTLSVTEGETYTFNINASGHPFWIKSVSSTGTGNQYNDGVTNNGTDNGTITWIVSYDALSTLYYNCQFHSGMAGTINVTDVPTTTAAPTTTTTTTAAPTVDIYIQNVGSLDIPIGSMTINGVAVTWVGSGPDFVLSAGDNGSFTSTEIGTYDVVIGYGGHTPGQRITFIDSAGTPTCQTLNGSIGTFTITNATITAGTTITVEGLDGVCP
jgi:hypothetical protein